MAVLVPIFGSQGNAGGLTITIGLTGQLNDLDDVIINNPQPGQTILYNGYVWTNEFNTALTDGISGLNIRVESLSGQVLQEIDNRQNADNFLQHQINELAVGYRLVFCENFTGNGVSNTFQLNGNVTNAQFVSGGWSTASVVNALPVNVTDMNGKPIYDGSILSLFTRNRIGVSNLNGSGLGTLDYIPLNNQQYKVWYWYELTSNDRIDNYYRDDFVASMEETDGKLASAIAVDTTTFTTVLSASDVNAQLAFNRLDKHNHNNLYYTKSEVRDITGNIQSQLYYISGNISDINNILNDQYSTLSYLTSITGQFALQSDLLGLESVVGQIASASGSYALNSSVQAMSAGLDSRLVIVENTNNAQQNTLSQLTSITGAAQGITQSLSAYSLNSSVQAMSAGLDSRLVIVETVNDAQQITLSQLTSISGTVTTETLSAYALNSSVQAMSAGLDTRLTVVEGQVVTISGNVQSLIDSNSITIERMIPMTTLDAYNQGGIEYYNGTGTSWGTLSNLISISGASSLATAVIRTATGTTSGYLSLSSIVGNFIEGEQITSSLGKVVTIRNFKKKFIGIQQIKKTNQNGFMGYYLPYGMAQAISGSGTGSASTDHFFWMPDNENALFVSPSFNSDIIIQKNYTGTIVQADQIGIGWEGSFFQLKVSGITILSSINGTDFSVPVSFKSTNITQSSSKFSGGGTFLGGVGISGSLYSANTFVDTITVNNLTGSANVLLTHDTSGRLQDSNISVSTITNITSNLNTITQSLTGFALNSVVQEMTAGLNARLTTAEGINVAQQETLSQLTSITASPASLDSRFVNVTGDAMFGILSMSGAPIDFDINIVPTWKEGRVFYDQVQHSLSYYNDNPEIMVNIGQEQLVRVRNSTNSTIFNGKVVCISGATGNRPNILLASKSTLNADSTIGMATHDINVNEDGYVTVQGLVNGLNTSGFSTEGIVLWLDNDGNVTETMPTSPDVKVRVGYLIRKHISLGSILISITVNPHINDLSDVSISGMQLGSILSWNGTVWSNQYNINSFATNTGVQAMSAGLNTRLTATEGINVAQQTTLSQLTTITGSIAGVSQSLSGYVSTENVNQAIRGVKVFDMGLDSATRMVTLPGISGDYANKTVTIAAADAVMYTTTDGTGLLGIYHIPQTVVTLPASADGSLAMIYADYNGGSPTYKAMVSNQTGVINCSNTLPIYRTTLWGGSVVTESINRTFIWEDVTYVKPIMSMITPDFGKQGITDQGVYIGNRIANAAGGDSSNVMIGSNTATVVVGGIRNVIIGCNAANTLINGVHNALYGTGSDVRTGSVIHGTAIGFMTNVDSFSTVVGAGSYSQSTRAFGEHACAFGHEAQTNNNYSLAIGASSLSEAQNACVIGAYAYNNETNTIQFGSSTAPFTKFKVYNGTKTYDLLATADVVNVLAVAVTAMSSTYITTQALSGYATTAQVANISANLANTLLSVNTPTTGSYTILSTERVIYTNIISGGSVYLPASPIVDEHHWIVNAETIDVALDGNGKTIWYDGNNQTIIIIPSDSSVHVHFNQNKNKWFII